MGGITIINFKKYPQYELYKLTLYWNKNKNKGLKPEELDTRSIYASIINRAYYSAYSFSLFWLEEFHKDEFFSMKEKNFGRGKNFVTEHNQVIIAIKKIKNYTLGNCLESLHNLRKKADYKMLVDLNISEVNDAIEYMSNIVEELVKDFK